MRKYNLNFKDLDKSTIQNIKLELAIQDKLGKFEFRNKFISSGFLSRDKTGQITYRPAIYKWKEESLMFILHYLMKWLYGEDYEKHMKRRRK